MSDQGSASKSGYMEWAHGMIVQLYTIALPAIGLPVCMIQPHKSDCNAARFHYSILSATQPVSGSDRISQRELLQSVSIQPRAHSGIGTTVNCLCMQGATIAKKQLAAVLGST